jgi:uncharacterized protein (TIGR02265 family)
MDEVRVKGIWFLDFAKMVRKLDDLPWSRYLTPEDLEIIRGDILPSQWYPADLYQRLGVAAFELVGQGKPENAQAAGRAFVERMINDEVLGPFLKTGEPGLAIQHFITIYRRLLTLGEARVEKTGEKRLRFTVHWRKGQIGIFPFIHNFAGFLFRLVEVNGGRQVKIAFDDQNLEERDSIEYDLQWQ